jgi:hypothetical protein
MSHATTDRIVSSAPNGSSRIGRLLVAFALLVATTSGAVMLGHSRGAASSEVALAASTSQSPAMASSDSTVPAAADVFSGRETSIEESAPTF